MKFNEKASRLLEIRLRPLGVFKQLDGSFAFSETGVLEQNMDDLILLQADSVEAVVKSLNQSLEDVIMDYCGIWKQFESFIDTIEKDTINTDISLEIIHSVLNNLVSLSHDYQDLDEVCDKIRRLRAIRQFIGDDDASVLSYYSTILYMVDDQLRTEYERILQIEELLEENKNTKEASSSKAVTAGLFGRDDGLGGRGRNTMWSTPYGGFDYANDRVMDGREIGEGKGHATEKFKTTNKFKRHPELNAYKKYFTYRMKPKMSKMKKRLKDRKKKNSKTKGQKRVELMGNGQVVVVSKPDPTYLNWVDQQRNKAYSWYNRDEKSIYPTWETYK
jgi:hypothetical protein